MAATRSEDWEQAISAHRLERLTAAWLERFDTVVVLAAHPDDETLGAGGLIASCVEHDIPVRVVVATASEPERLDELQTALHRLGIHDRPSHLGLMDGALKNTAEELRNALETTLTTLDTRHVLVVAPWPGDRHGDHRTLGREAAALCREHGHTLRFYPIWLWQWGRPEDMPWSQASEIELATTTRQRKREALEAFASQLHSESNPHGVLTSTFLARAASGAELLIEPNTAPDGDRFQTLHLRNPDPWSVRTLWYERRKRNLMLAALPREHYEHAFELGCSNGETTAALAHRCTDVLAVDAAPAAVSLATARTASMTNVTVQQMHLPTAWPASRFDLIVISEVAYYLTADQWESAIGQTLQSLQRGGIVVLCHWTGDADDFAQSGRAVHDRFAQRSGLRRLVEHAEEDFLLEVYG
ncbi:PIG-L family deacetylase [Planctomonas sp. JC2975]|uniref:PIG-L family deacetylase n=1 Tax=Planctomonas sp. JC2975 TaxID=2729626 RepID=UPI003211D6F2